MSHLHATLLSAVASTPMDPRCFRCSRSPCFLLLGAPELAFARSPHSRPWEAPTRADPAKLSLLGLTRSRPLGGFLRIPPLPLEGARVGAREGAPPAPGISLLPPPANPGRWLGVQWTGGVRLGRGGGLGLPGRGNVAAQGWIVGLMGLAGSRIGSGGWWVCLLVWMLDGCRMLFYS